MKPIKFYRPFVIFDILSNSSYPLRPIALINIHGLVALELLFNKRQVVVPGLPELQPLLYSDWHQQHTVLNPFDVHLLPLETKCFG
jgi:hypothetical protein